MNRKTLESTCSRLAKSGDLVRNPDRDAMNGLPLQGADKIS
ncbi:hypothetical protein ACIBCA_19260 [Kitasatospora sp. NPDC051170]